jgi:HEAT repeats
MARETVRRLAEDVGRILVAGGHLAPADPELKKDHQALVALAAQVGDKAPVMVRLAETAGRATSGAGRPAVAELISLATTTAQVKAAQAVAAAPGPRRPLAEVPPVATPCNGKDLDELHAALVEKGSGRKEIIERAVEGGYIADLRLVEALIYAMGDAWVGEVVSEKAIPALGRAVVRPIREHLYIRCGSALDGRRLRALVAVQKQGALDLLAEAVKEGSSEVREAAMDAIADHVAGVPEFEPYALAAAARDRVPGIKRAALRALGGYASDASLEAILDALDKVSLTDAAAEALGTSTNPRAVEKILARLGKAVTAAEKAHPGGEVQERTRHLVVLLLGALARHQHPEIANAAMDLVDALGAPAAWAAVGSADRTQLVRLADELGGDSAELFPVAVAAAVKLGADEAFARLQAPFKAPGLLQKLKTDRHRRARLDTVLGYLADHPEALDERWRVFLLEVLHKGAPEHTARVVGVLGNAREPRAVPALVALLATEKKEAVLVAVIHALGRIGDPRALDPMLARIGVGAARAAIHEAVLAIDDRSSVEKVRAIFVQQKNPDAWESWHVKSLLRTLESRFPGS